MKCVRSARMIIRLPNSIFLKEQYCPLARFFTRGIIWAVFVNLLTARLPFEHSIGMGHTARQRRSQEIWKQSFHSLATTYKLRLFLTYRFTVLTTQHVAGG